MFRTELVLVAALVLLPAAAAAPATNYVRFYSYPEVGYEQGDAVRVDFYADFVRNGVPQADLVKIQVLDDQAQPFDVAGAQDLADGIRPGEHTFNFGRLDVGQYQLRVKISSGGVSRTFSMDVNVVLPSIGYEVRLESGPGKDGTVFFTPNNPDIRHNFTLTAYTLTAGGAKTLKQVTTWNATTMRVPYVEGQDVLVDVRDPNGWVNHDTDGRPLVHDPDYCIAEACKDTQFRFIIAGVLGVAALACFVWWMLSNRPRKDVNTNA